MIHQGKMGRPAKKIPQQDSLASLSRGTRKEHPQVSISSSEGKGITQERSWSDRFRGEWKHLYEGILITLKLFW